jgi:hypothetical protein
VFPEAQRREWAATADISSEGLGNNSEASRAGFAAAISVYRPGKRSPDWFKIKFKGNLLRDREIDTTMRVCDVRPESL